MNSAAALVNAPVATSQAAPGGCARRAAKAASMAGGEVTASTVGVGSREVPSRPDSPWMSVGGCMAGRERALEAPI